VANVRPADPSADHQRAKLDLTGSLDRDFANQLAGAAVPSIE
jgi:hypothetical protein